MFFHQRNKITFGANEEDPAVLAEKIQAIAYLVNGMFGENLKQDDEGNEHLWRLSEHMSNSDPVGFNTEDKIMKAFKTLEKHRATKQDRLLKMAEKAPVAEEIRDDQSDSTVDLWIGPTEEDESLYDDENTILNKDRHYFGDKAKTDFWKMYKSGRTFKDHDENNIQDPRLAYLKT